MSEVVNNIGKLFYKDYYKEVKFKDVIDGREGKPVDINKPIKESKFLPIPKPEIPEAKDKNGLVCLKFRIDYPGLITGVGLPHGCKKITGGYELGMHFDYTYGMPVVYGSTVKGVLREYFEEFIKKPLTDLDDLIQDIFVGRTRNTTKDIYKDGKLDKKGYDNKSIYKRDIFFDAVITEPHNGKFLVDDFITPHKNGPLKNPIPIPMLKIAPGCIIEFRFKLVDSGNFDIEAKKNLFKTILETVGIGAKTNVGYGQLTYIEDDNANS